ncbi:hypothetical protein [Sphingomonas fuzhouensis]|uniref:hypothetical protein n=1 Tax=Sphingomonas fuzhouensis TaxID=3106033 RepID=UPI002AFE3834|nr:hypothetical protein [Sphingomonas sp. SGZ-02]
MIAWALLAVSGPGPATVADPVPPVFYNRPGAKVEDVEAERRLCRRITTGPTTGGERPDGAALLDNGARAVDPGTSIDACMKERGWRLYALSARERAVLAGLGSEARSRIWTRLAGRARPGMGRQVR